MDVTDHASSSTRPVLYRRIPDETLPIDHVRAPRTARTGEVLRSPEPYLVSRSACRLDSRFGRETTSPHPDWLSDTASLSSARLSGRSSRMEPGADRRSIHDGTSPDRACLGWVGGLSHEARRDPVRALPNRYAIVSSGSLLWVRHPLRQAAGIPFEHHHRLAVSQRRKLPNRRGKNLFQVNMITHTKPDDQIPSTGDQFDADNLPELPQDRYGLDHRFVLCQCYSHEHLERISEHGRVHFRPISGNHPGALHALDPLPDCAG